MAQTINSKMNTYLITTKYNLKLTVYADRQTIGTERLFSFRGRTVFSMLDEDIKTIRFYNPICQEWQDGY